MNHFLKNLFFGSFIIPFFATAQYAGNNHIPQVHRSSGLETAAGKWTFSMYPGHIIKATFLPVNSKHNEQVSDAVIARPLDQESKTFTRANTTYFQWDKETMITVDANNQVDFKVGAKNNIILLDPFDSITSKGFRFKLKKDEMIFGTGERSVPLNRRGYRLPLNNSPAYGYSLNAEALNFSVPFILSNKMYAIFFDNPSRGYLDIGKTDPDVFEYSVTSGELSFYIIPGQDYEGILESYHKLVGTAPLPPRWAMGNLVSRFGYRSEDQVKEITSRMKKDSVPFDAVIFDLFWFGDSIKNTLGNLSWVNKKAWPDPERMIREYNKENIKTILITEPFVLNTSLSYQESKAFHATDSAGNPYILQEFYFGKGGIIDIFRKDAQQWFYKKYKAQMDIGVTGWWGDLGEPENHPADVYHNLRDLGFNRKFSSGEIHNIYGHYWSKMLALNFKKDYPGKRLFHLNRSGYAGSPRYSSFPWSGDVSRSWDGLKGQLPLIQGMSLSGIPYMHSDAGGFAGGDGDAELYVRWLQFAAFTPIYRPHGTALGNLEPAAKDIPSEAALWDEPARTLARQAAITRYNWLPYNYNLTYLQAIHGKPLVTPLFFLDKADSNVYKSADQYMWGDEVMVVPITDKGQTAKKIYIPNGNWINVNNGKVYPGPLWTIDSSINMQSIPVFAKEGSFLPSLPGLQNTAEYNEKILHISYYASGKPSKYELYEDDGSDANALTKGNYEITSFNSTGEQNGTCTIHISTKGKGYTGRPARRKMVLTIVGANQQPSTIKIDGNTISVSDSVDQQKDQIIIPLELTRRPMYIQIKYKNLNKIK